MAFNPAVLTALEEVSEPSSTSAIAHYPNTQAIITFRGTSYKTTKPIVKKILDKHSLKWNYSQFSWISPETPSTRVILDSGTGPTTLTICSVNPDEIDPIITDFTAVIEFLKTKGTTSIDLSQPTNPQRQPTLSDYLPYINTIVERERPSMTTHFKTQPKSDYHIYLLTVALINRVKLAITLGRNPHVAIRRLTTR